MNVRERPIPSRAELRAALETAPRRGFGRAQRIRELYLAGCTTVEILLALGTSSQEVRRALRGHHP